MPNCQLPDGDQLYYEVHGSGPALLLVPGLSGVATFWQPHVAELAEHFTVVLHDHRGTGRSSISLIDYSVEQMSADLLCLMDHLRLDRAHLVGHSTGGAIGQTLAIDHPQRLDRLVLSSTWPGVDNYFKLLFQVRADILRGLGPAAYLRANGLFLKPSWWLRDHPDEAQVSDAQAGEQLPDPRVVLSRIEAITRFDRRADLGRIETPTLIICARDDIITPAYFSEELNRRIANSQLDLLPQGGHFLPQLFAGQFRRAVLAFLQPAPTT